MTVSYPKHICYRMGGFWGKQMHAVARTPEEEQSIRALTEDRGHKITCTQAIEDMDERARRQFVETEDVGFRKDYRDHADDPQLPF